MSETWFAEGLRFTCTRCGKCCTGTPGFVWVDDDEVAAIAGHRGEPLHEVLGLYTRSVERGRTLRERPNGDCVFYHRERGCTIYEVRPRQCRTWPFWESSAGTPAAWKETQSICPGAGKGDWIPAEEITRRINVIKL